MILFLCSRVINGKLRLDDPRWKKKPGFLKRVIHELLNADLEWLIIEQLGEDYPYKETEEK